MRSERSSKVVVTTVTPALTTTTPGALSLSVTVTGSYFHVRDFLHNLRTQVRFGKDGRVLANGRLYDVQSVNIQQGSGASAAHGAARSDRRDLRTACPGSRSEGPRRRTASAAGAGTTN